MTDLTRIHAAARTLEQERSVRGAFARGRLKHVPRRHESRRLVLACAAEGFEPGCDYTEREVNEILHELHDDHAALRRYLVDDGLLGRSDDGRRYWRPVSPSGA